MMMQPIESHLNSESTARKRIMNAPVMIDLRNIYRSQDVRAKGFSYRGIGTDVGTGPIAKA